MWYVIDAVDRVAEVGGGWDAHAARNGAFGISARSVRGRPIWSFFSGQAVRYHYAQLFETVRQTQRAAAVRLRDDGPGRQTLRELIIAPGPRQSIRITSVVLRERAVLNSPLWDAALSRGVAQWRVCSWCKSVDDGTRWRPPAAAAAAAAQLGAAQMPQLSHEACPCCAKRMERTTQALLLPALQAA